VAKTLGGGGHPQAAGCVIAGPLSAARAWLLDLLRPLVNDAPVHQAPVG
jgi:nanoRNase/pAp phosphatase (c-di-AMP/oligoRNAs hydrolase)